MATQSNNVILQLGHLSHTEKAHRFSVILNCREDANLRLVLRRVFQTLPLAKVAYLYEVAMEAVRTGMSHARLSTSNMPKNLPIFLCAATRRDNPVRQRTPIGELIDQLRCSPYTTGAEVRAMRLSVPAAKKF